MSVRFCVFTRPDNEPPGHFNVIRMNGNISLFSLDPNADGISDASVFHRLVWIEIKRGAMLGGPNRKQHPSDCRDPASPGGLIASSLIGKRETERKIRRARHHRARTLMTPIYSLQSARNRLICNGLKRHRFGSNSLIFQRSKLTLNQRVPGSSPGAPTISSKT